MNDPLKMVHRSTERSNTMAKNDYPVIVYQIFLNDPLKMVHRSTK